MEVKAKISDCLPVISNNYTTIIPFDKLNEYLLARAYSLEEIIPLLEDQAQDEQTKSIGFFIVASMCTIRTFKANINANIPRLTAILNEEIKKFAKERITDPCSVLAIYCMISLIVWMRKNMELYNEKHKAFIQALSPAFTILAKAIDDIDPDQIGRAHV